MKNTLRPIAALAMLLLAACAPEVQDYTPPTQPPLIKSDAFLPGDGAQLPLRGWLPKGKPRAVVVALHGFNDYGNAFEMPARTFAARGIAVYAYDQRGFGGSTQPGIWAGEENLTSDAKQMVKAAQARWPGVPVFLLGESMGGAVAIAAMTEPGAPKVHGVILSAPAVWGGETIPLLYRLSLWTAAHIFPGMKFTGDGLDIQASDNIPMLRELGRDPLVIKETRADAIYGVVHLMDRAYDDAPKLGVPVLLAYGDNDEVIPPEPVERVAEQLGQEQFVRFPEGYHMLMRDLERDKVHNKMVEWILELSKNNRLAQKK